MISFGMFLRLNTSEAMRARSIVYQGGFTLLKWDQGER